MRRRRLRPPVSRGTHTHTRTARPAPASPIPIRIGPTPPRSRSSFLLCPLSDLIKDARWWVGGGGGLKGVSAFHRPVKLTGPAPASNTPCLCRPSGPYTSAYAAVPVETRPLIRVLTRPPTMPLAGARGGLRSVPARGGGAPVRGRRAGGCSDTLTHTRPGRGRKRQIERGTDGRTDGDAELQGGGWRGGGGELSTAQKQDQHPSAPPSLPHSLASAPRASARSIPASRASPARASLLPTHGAVVGVTAI